MKAASLGKTVSIDAVDISFDGKSAILSNASIKLDEGHRYALIGENGSGKTTLLRRMALGAIPGWPGHLRIHYLQQEDFVVSDSMTVLDYVLAETENLMRLRKEEQELERELDELAGEDEDAMVEITERLCAIADAIEKIELSAKTKVDSTPSNAPTATATTTATAASTKSNSTSSKKPTTSSKAATNGKAPSSSTISQSNANSKDSVVQSAERERLKTLPVPQKSIFKGLGLVSLVAQKMSKLSGGQRSRCALAKALLSVEKGECDLLLLDECTNHLDVSCTTFVQQYISNITSCIVVAVSHDEAFLEAICTDVMTIDIASHQLSYFPGGIADYWRNIEEQAKFMEARLDSQHRKEEHIEKSLQYAREKGLDSTIRNKEKKLVRASMTSRADGKKFKLFSLKTLDEDALRMPDVVSATRNTTRLDHPWIFDASRYQHGARSKLIKFSFPEPADLRTSATRPLLTLEKCKFRWEGNDTDPVLRNVTLNLSMGSRVALIGQNGAGKTTLLTALSRILDQDAGNAVATAAAGNSVDGSRKAILSGVHQIAPNVRAGFVAQQHVDDLVHYLLKSPMEYLRHYLMEKSGSNWTDLELRSHLGKFGLGGNISLQPIGAMSGGEKARLAMAAACVYSPQILLLDEPTNHLSPASLIALKSACVEFQGSIVFSSHNKEFVDQVATIKCTLSGGTMTETVAVVSDATSSQTKGK